MDWTQALDGYCERVDASFWAEPVNAVTNAAFLIAAVIMWRRCYGLGWGRWLSAVLFAIGVGSFLFHTYAQPWAGVADVVPIAVFVFSYIWLANRVFWGLSPLWSALGLVAFVPFAMLVTPVAQMVPVLGVSGAYWPVWLAIALYAIALGRQWPAVGRGLGIGAALLFASLTFRSFDMVVCPAFALGTHFAWHILNAIMLGWMIEVYRRHMLAQPATAR